MSDKTQIISHDGAYLKVKPLSTQETLIVPGGRQTLKLEMQNLK